MSSPVEPSALASRTATSATDVQRSHGRLAIDPPGVADHQDRAAGRPRAASSQPGKNVRWAGETSAKIHQDDDRERHRQARLAADRRRRSSRLEVVRVDVANGLVADRLVDVVRGRVRGVGEQEAEAATGVERVLADRCDEGARVAASASVGGV